MHKNVVSEEVWSAFSWLYRLRVAMNYKSRGKYKNWGEIWNYQILQNASLAWTENHEFCRLLKVYFTVSVRETIKIALEWRSCAINLFVSGA